MSNSKELSSDILRKLYYDNHQYCPNCGSKNLTKTLAAYIFNPQKPNDFKDLNSAKCNTCGWGGTVHDLVGEHGSANTPKENTVIDEDYVDFEVAKLIKKKNVKIPFAAVYDNNGNFYESLGDCPYSKDEILYGAPTLYKIMKWLRLEQGVQIQIHTGIFNKKPSFGYTFTLVSLTQRNFLGLNKRVVEYPNYEDAVNAALKFYFTKIFK